jgi:MFS transporter, PPP family, 3-phenylpropionic acid transporter
VRVAHGALKAGYFGYFAAVGVFQPYWSLQLAGQGFTPPAIGALLAAVSVARVVAPPVQARIAGRVGDDGRALAVAAAVAALLVPCIAAAHDFRVALVLMALYALCFNGFMPVYDALALRLLGADQYRYGRLRLWGSIGYVAASAVVGELVGRFGGSAIPGALALCLVATASVCRGLSGVAAVAPQAAHGPAPRQPGAGWFLLVCFLQLASFGAYYGFYGLYLESYGYSSAAIGRYFALGVLAEMVFFFSAAPLLARVPAYRLLALAIGATALRWLMIASFPGSAWILALAQVMHLFGFALFHSVTVLLAPQLLGRGPERSQALVSSAGWGAGVAAGTLLAGRIWQAGGPRLMYVAAAGVAALALVVVATRLRGGQLVYSPAATAMEARA